MKRDKVFLYFGIPNANWFVTGKDREDAARRLLGYVIAQQDKHQKESADEVHAKIQEAKTKRVEGFDTMPFFHLARATGLFQQCVECTAEMELIARHISRRAKRINEWFNLHRITPIHGNVGDGVFPGGHIDDGSYYPLPSMALTTTSVLEEDDVFELKIEPEGFNIIIAPGTPGSNGAKS